MLQEQAKIFGWLHMLLEFFLVSLAFAISIELRHSFFMADVVYRFTHIIIHRPDYHFEAYISYILMGAIYWVLTLKSFGAYQSMRQLSYAQLAWLVSKSVMVASLVYSTILVLVNAKLTGRGFVILVLGIGLSLLLTERFILLFAFHAIRKKGYNYRQFLIVGSGPRAVAFANLLQSHQEWGFKLLGFIDESERVGKEINGKKVIGSFADMESIIDNNIVDEVVFCMPRKWLDKVEKYVLICEEVGVKVHLPLDLFNTAIAKPRLSKLEDFPLLSLESTPSHAWALFVKRGMDIAISAGLLIIISPVLLLIALLVKFTSPGPVFFGQERCGTNCRKFTMWKFRTMIKNADELKAKLSKLNEMSGPVFKIKNDPRLTPLGRFLRKFSLDELPQFLNVLKGDMSIVGPRPPIPSEVKGYDRWQRRRLSMRPGITCLWQVGGRNKICFKDWVKLDLEYIDNWCLAMDVIIIFKTIPAVLKGSGA